MVRFHHKAQILILITMSKFIEQLEALQDIEEQMADLNATYCNCECVAYDNGVGCYDDCPILALLQELDAKANKLLKTL